MHLNNYIVLAEEIYFQWKTNFNIFAFIHIQPG